LDFKTRSGLGRTSAVIAIGLMADLEKRLDALILFIELKNCENIKCII